MNSRTKQIVAALAVTAFTLAFTAAPASAGPRVEQRTVWCC